MNRPEYFIGLYTLLVCMTVLCCSLNSTVSAQISPADIEQGKKFQFDSPAKYLDSLKKVFDSISLRKVVGDNQSLAKMSDAVSSIKHKIKATNVDSAWKNRLNLPDSKTKASSDALLRFDGAMVSYQFSYRSTVDTPFIERNIQQHSLAGDIQFTVGELVPIRTRYFLRNTNSSLFRDIYDVRVDFDPNAFRNNIRSGLEKRISSTIAELKAPIDDDWLASKLSEWNALIAQFDNPAFLQQLIEANKILKIPAFTYDHQLPDSLAKRRSDSLKTEAQMFLEKYGEGRRLVDSLSGKVDSFKVALGKASTRIRKLKNISSGQISDLASYENWHQAINEAAGTNSKILKKYEWLLGLRQLGIGRNQVNYSELTAKNLSVTGINFEYNSWYYVAVSAGLVDYRFRDFTLQPQKKLKQYMYLLRLGVGQLHRNYVIVSAFKGQKQLYASSDNAPGLAPLAVSGLSVESKWQISRNIYLQGEIAQSFSADFRYNQPSTPKGWDFSDKTNKAYSVKWFSSFSKTGSRLEAMYKYTGSNYQSFSSFQTNAAFKTWHLKADQLLFRKQLRLSGALRSNDFSNPYIIQNYSSNNIYKSIYASFRRKKWPTLSAGYIPSAQLTKLGNQIYENRFYTFNTGVSHFYKLGTIRAASTVIYNRFYNNSTDSGFIYFNAINLLVGQNFFFKHFSATLNLSTITNPDYRFIVVDENIQFNFLSWGLTTLGVKVNMLNSQVPKLGFYGNAQIRINARDIVYVSYDQGYLPGRKNELVHNDFVQVSFVKYFK